MYMKLQLENRGLLTTWAYEGRERGDKKRVMIGLIAIPTHLSRAQTASTAHCHHTTRGRERQHLDT